MIFLTTTAETLTGAVEQVAEQRQWIDGVELRVDLLLESERETAPRFRALVDSLESRRTSHIPLIATIRRETDGGRSNQTDVARLKSLSACAASGFDFVDVESDVAPMLRSGDLGAALIGSGVTPIVSTHDFAGVPEGVTDLVDAAAAVGQNAIVKLAATPNSTADLVRLIRIADDFGARRVEHIVLGMGAFGFPTRVLTHRLGNVLTFASAPGDTAAPGHIDPETLATQYRISEATDDTRYFSVIGNPIGHSRSPEYHNGRFSSDGINAIYLPVLVDDTRDHFALAEAIPLLGFSVTIPHKQAVIPSLAETGEDVRAAGACNTVVRCPGGWKGINTDVLGFLAPLEEVLDRDLSACRVLMIGAGGAARGIAYGLLKAGSEVTVWNRTESRARGLVADLTEFSLPGSIRAVGSVTADATERPDIVINTTSVGMHGSGDPIDWFAFTGDEVVYDIVYTPPETPLIQRAAAAGCRVITGDRMFDAQAAAQYELYRVLATAGLGAASPDQT